jgi:hypothetical protein
VESLADRSIHQGTSKTIWNIRNNLMRSNNNVSQIRVQEDNTLFIHLDQTQIITHTMIKIHFNNIKEDPILTILLSSITLSSRHSLHLKETSLIVIFLQLNSGQGLLLDRKIKIAKKRKFLVPLLILPIIYQRNR